VDLKLVPRADDRGHRPGFPWRRGGRRPVRPSGRIRRFSFVLVAMALSVSCAHTPPDAVRLSEVMGQDLAEVRRAHRELVRVYFGRLKASVDAFVDGVYRPYVIERAIDGSNLLAELDRARKPHAVLDPLDVLEGFVEEATAQVERYRAELRVPLDAQERELLSDIDSAHDRLAQANAALTAHLRSIRKVEAEQDTLLSAVGIPVDLRSRLSGGLVRLSGQVERFLGNARSTSAALDSLPGELRRALGQPK